MKIASTKAVLLVLTMASVFSLTGCGSSGGGGGGTAASPNGIYTGSITGGVGGVVNGQEKGVIYNNKMMVFSSVNGIRQMFESTLTVTGTNLSGNITYYTASSVQSSSSLTLSGSFVANTSATINFTDATGTQPPDGTINLVSDTALFNRGSDSATIAFTWQGAHGTLGNSSTIMVSATGDITGGSSLGCTYMGTILPANTSINIYNINLVTGSDCDDTVSEFLVKDTTYIGFAWTEGSNNEILNFTVSDGKNSRSIVLTRN